MNEYTDGYTQGRADKLAGLEAMVSDGEGSGSSDWYQGYLAGYEGLPLRSPVIGDGCDPPHHESTATLDTIRRAT